MCARLPVILMHQRDLGETVAVTHKSKSTPSFDTMLCVSTLIPWILQKHWTVEVGGSAVAIEVSEKKLSQIKGTMWRACKHT